MSISLLEPAPGRADAVPAGVPSGADVSGADVGGLVTEAAAWLGRAARVPVAGVGEEVLETVIGSLAGLESRAVALRMALSAEADRRRVAEETAETGTDAWLARLTGSTRAQAAGGLRLARLLQDKYACTREAFAAGQLRLEQVRVVVNAAEQSPPEATAGQVAAAEEWLVARATGAGTRSGRGLDAKRLRQAARRMFAGVDAGLAERHAAILLGREARSAQAETFFALHDNGDGSFSGRFRIPELHGRLLSQVLDRLTAPRRLSRDRAGNPVTDPTAPGPGWGVNLFETRGAAFCELIEHLPANGWPGHAGTGAELLVTIDLDALLAGLSELGVAGLDGGVAITAAEARRLACGAGLVPAVLGGDSMPLDLGRSRRLHTRTQRRALALLHDTCAVAGCDRPFAWCEIHHRLFWSAGGGTDLNDGVPLCGHHHRRAHDARYQLHRRADGEWAFHRRT